MRRFTTSLSSVSTCVFCELATATVRSRKPRFAVSSLMRVNRIYPGCSSMSTLRSLPLNYKRLHQEWKRPYHTSHRKETSDSNVDAARELRANIKDGKLSILVEGRVNDFSTNWFSLPLTQRHQGKVKEHSPKEVYAKFKIYAEAVRKRVDTPEMFEGEGEPKLPSFESPLGYYIPPLSHFRYAYVHAGVKGIDELILDSFFQSVYPDLPAASALSLERLADLRNPHEWDSRTRGMKRTWHLHVGPTNSGKTYHALKRLEEAKDGLYAGPLRLLAHEIYERLNQKGIACNLITGEEQRVADKHARVISSTVEMVNTTHPVEVAVIDEIQMIGDEERGWAWTQALLGVRAKEVHLCGEVRSTELIQKLADLCGDDLVIHTYKRLGPLEVEKTSLGNNLANVKKGDCLIAFSRKALYSLKHKLETLGKKCAIIYGALPPEVRSQQAAAFNDPNNDVDILVATDAIGMGLNLNIRRIVFTSLKKFDGRKSVMIGPSSIQQIAGRAGRYKVAPFGGSKDQEMGKKEEKRGEDDEPVLSPGHPLPQVPLPAAPTVGYVTTFAPDDLNKVRAAMATVLEPIRTAGILPSNQMQERFFAFAPPLQPFAKTLMNLKRSIRVSPLYHICEMGDLVKAAEELDNLKGLTNVEKSILCATPYLSMEKGTYFFSKFCEQIAANVQFSLLDVAKLPIELLDKPVKANDPKSLIELEILHKVTMMWLWMSYRFPYNLHPKDSAMEVKQCCEHRIDEALSKGYRYNRKDRETHLPEIFKEFGIEEKEVVDPKVAEASNGQNVPDLTMSEINPGEIRFSPKTVLRNDKPKKKAKKATKIASERV